MTFEYLPPDILQEITSFLISFDLVSLVSLSKLMRHKFVNQGGVTRYNAPLIYEKKELLNYLMFGRNITSFSFSCKHEVMCKILSNFKGGSHIHHISLTYIQPSIKGPGLGASVLKNCPNLISYTVSRIFDISLEQVKALPRNLKTLWLIGSRNHTDDILPHLPPGLTKLHLPDQSLVSFRQILCLPKTLKKLHFVAAIPGNIDESHFAESFDLHFDDKADRTRLYKLFDETPKSDSIISENHFYLDLNAATYENAIKNGDVQLPTSGAMLWTKLLGFGIFNQFPELSSLTCLLQIPKIADLLCLPKSINSLEATGRLRHFESWLLPRQLTSLDLHSMIMIGYDPALLLEDLPPSLTRLVLPSGFGNPSPDTVITFPPNLRILVIPQVQFHANMGKAIQQLKYLTSLYHSIADNRSWKMPPTVTRLKCVVSYLRDLDFEDLSRLAFVRLLASNVVTSEEVEVFQALGLVIKFDSIHISMPSLTTILESLQYPVPIDLNDASLHGLVSRFYRYPLQMVHYDDFSSSIFKALPRTTKSIALSKPFSIWNDDEIKNIPASLMELQLQAELGFTAYMNMNHLTKLQSLVLLETTVPDEAIPLIASLPSLLSISMEKLKLSWWSLEKITGNAATPFSLKAEAIAQFSSKTRVSCSYFIYEIENSSSKHIPKHVDTVCLNSNLGDEFVAGLPPTLTRLELPESVVITNVGLSHLPATLISLLLPANLFINDEGLVFLPPDLKELSLTYNQHITDKGISLLPRSITKLEISVAKISFRCFPHLPPNLTYLDVSGVENLRFACPDHLPTSLTSISCDPVFLRACLLSLPNLDKSRCSDAAAVEGSNQLDDLFSF